MKKRFIACMLSALLALSVFLPVGAAPDENWNQKITPELWENIEKTKSKDAIQVYVWMTDIDWNNIEQKVYKETGYNISNIEQKYEAIDKKAFKMKPESDEYFKLMLEYKEKTAEPREKERIATDTYIEAKRRYSREAHNKLNSETIKNLGIDEKCVIFSSQYAPMIIATLTVDEIYKISGSKMVTLIDLEEEREYKNFGMDSAIKTVRAHTLRDTRGYDGAGVKIGQIEEYHPENKDVLQGVYTYLTGQHNSNSHHAYYVGSIMHTIAPQASYYSAAITPDYNCYARIEELITAGCSVINHSAGFDRSGSWNSINWYDNLEKWIDHIEGPHGISFVQAAGNTGEAEGYVASPGLAYNAITVGAINDNNTVDNSDDTVRSFSSSVNGGSDGCAKPDLMAPDTAIANLGGTSFSAPVVSGVIAQLMEFKPYLKGNSRLVKAVLTASCGYKASESIYSGLTAVEGAGIINANTAYLILASNQYYSGSFTASELNYTISLTGSPSRVGLAFARISSIGSNHTSGTVTAGTYVDIHMTLYRPNSDILGQSTLTMSSTEMICITNTWETYRLRIWRGNSADTGKTVWYSVAWT